MADLKTDYVNDVLDADVNTERTYNIVDSQGNIIYANARIRETTVFTTEGDKYGAIQVNEQNTAINQQNEAINQLGADIAQINVDLSDKVSKTGDTISGNLSISGNLTVQNINAFLHNKVSGTNVAWKDCPLTTDGWYYYEAANITTYDLPFTHCIVQVYKTTAARGVAIAYRWDNGRPMTWINNLHDTWRGWKSIGSNYITLKAAATYSSPTVVTLAETMLNYSKLAFNLLEGDQVVDYVEVPVRRFQAGNYFVLHSKQTDNSYALIVRHPENMNNEVNIAAISGSPKIEIQGIY